MRRPVFPRGSHINDRNLTGAQDNLDLPLKALASTASSFGEPAHSDSFFGDFSVTLCQQRLIITTPFDLKRLKNTLEERML